jgi:hypothetical protein
MYPRERPVLPRTIAMGHWLLSLMELGRRRLASLSALPLVEQASRCWAVCGGLLFLPVCVSPLNAMIPFMGIVQSVVVREAVSPRVVNNQSTQLGALELSCRELNEVQVS